MKTTSTSIILFLAIAFLSCQKHDNSLESVNNIIVANGKIKNPTWLVHIVDSVAHLYKPSPVTHEFPYPWVYSVSHKDQEYILVVDGFNSCYTCGNLFFSVSGDYIHASDYPNTGLYEKLSEEENRTLIWREE